ncbi:MAG: hypothetical protein JSW27_04425 [Phycisphaerales bacterium]|nr:MAG: hypothetical protein JSW27_04425 [Phycisphaerales bacterium]
MYEEYAFQGNPIFLIILISLIIFMVVVTNVVTILILCKIFSKAGYHWAMGLLALVPVVNLFLPFYLAFADWPVRRELREARQQLGIVPGQNVIPR